MVGGWVLGVWWWWLWVQIMWALSTLNDLLERMVVGGGGWVVAGWWWVVVVGAENVGSVQSE
jgi:hypothetical protein